MTRYTPEVEDGTLFLVGDDDRLEIGTDDDVLAAVGEDHHTLEYDHKQRTQPWLDAADGTLDVDIREAVTTLPHGPDTISELRRYDMSTEQYGLPRRTVEFADIIVEILEGQGKE